MKYRSIFVIAPAFFLITQTGALWLWRLGSTLSFLIGIVILLGFVALAFVCCYQLLQCTIEKFRNKPRNIATVMLGIVLILSILWPKGIIDFEKSGTKELLVAGREGAANCYTRLRLKADGSFEERTTCFGISVVKGIYRTAGDTIYFSANGTRSGESGYYQFGILRNGYITSSSKQWHIVRHQDASDTVGTFLFVIEGDPKKMISGGNVSYQHSLP